MTLHNNSTKVAVGLLVALCAAFAEAKEPPPPPRNVAIVVHDGVELLDFAGPAEVFANASYRGRHAFKVYTVAPSAKPCQTQQAVTVTPQYSIDNCPEPAIIVIPGGATQNLTNDKRFMDWVKRTAPQAEITMTVCTGAFTLAELGLLDGMEATTHFSAIASMKEEHPKIKVREDVRFVDNGRIVTTAGISAGIDGALHVVSRLTSEEAAWNTARYMEYDWEPPALKEGAAPAKALARTAMEHRVYRRWDKAAAAYEELLKLEPDNSEAMLKLGQCQLGMERWDTAAKSLKRAQELGQNDAFVMSLLARAQLGAKQYDAAIKSYIDAIELGQADVNNLYNLACAYALNGEKEQAVSSLDRALKEGPWMKAQAQRDEDLASLRDDARFKALVAAD